ncbi:MULTISPECIES: acyl-CoA synthetase [Microbacterium]|uniref:Acyl-CoA synthetase n=1 Tax=Microbacterium wangchenii TaxID=2541726 RepID=A0ABX5T056_9MICO|nr:MULTISPECIES: acyl-CoA synthetase [Microbacterium]MCK6066196.1 acyl-CoA synthetase [Microbacterium sp. EYE_512]QBR90469.1 acyl-CoA synthetase [Microbacterium wangchenii]TXK14495.1 acyl-CoA synthetase [Microbacterium wangchenii]
MTASPSVRAFEVRHLQLARALFAALAAVMVTFSPDHSAALGLSVFSGFAIATGLVFALAAWLVYPAGGRAPALVLAALNLAAGMVVGVAPWRTTTMLFIVFIAWGALTGLVEIVAGVRERRGQAKRGAPRDTLNVGILSAAFAVGVAVVPAGYALEYYIEEVGQSFTLTGTIIAVGIFGVYAAILAVYLGIAGFSPRRDAAAAPTSAEEVGA